MMAAISRQGTAVLLLIGARGSARERGVRVISVVHAVEHSEVKIVYLGNLDAALLHRRDEMHTGPVIPGYSYRHQRNELFLRGIRDRFVAKINVFCKPVYAGFLAAIIVTVIASCASIPPLWQRNIGDADFPANEGSSGIVVGSVSAPPVPYGYSPAPDTAHYYHEVVKFYFRSRVRGGQEGVLTSGSRHPMIDYVPACDAEGLADECGRLFAVRLAAGTYEIHEAFYGNTNHPVWERPAVFSVAGGETIYLGNLYAEYCKGRPVRSRGAILGMDVSIRDRYERDSALIRQRFPALQEVEIIRQPLPDPAWRYRVPFIPNDWGTCAPGL